MSAENPQSLRVRPERDDGVASVRIDHAADVATTALSAASRPLVTDRLLARLRASPPCFF
jgi:hypothetical protein